MSDQDRDFEDEVETATRDLPDEAKESCKAILALCDAMVREINTLRSDLEDARDDQDRGDRDEARGIVADWVDDLRCAVERPVGKLEFKVTNQRAFDRAMLALLDRASINVMGA